MCLDAASRHTTTSPVVACVVCVCGTEGTVPMADDPEDMLDRQKCLDALAAVRRVKWFHVSCSHSYILLSRVGQYLPVSHVMSRTLSHHVLVAGGRIPASCK